MARMSDETKQHLLGEMGSALIQQHLAGQGIQTYAPWHVFHRACDLIACARPSYEVTNDDRIIPISYSPIGRKLSIQVKCKVPWVTEAAQSFTQYQLLHYKTADLIYFICAPVQGKFEDQDIWKGNIYKGVPSQLVTRQKKTRGGREMTLIPLDQPNLKLEFTIKNKECLDLMRELITPEG
jgi:hypothetical protein